MDRTDPSLPADNCSSNPPLTQAFARFVTDHDYSSIPEPAHRAAKQAIRDCIGGAIAGLGEPVARIVSEQARGIPGPATVWGAAAPTSVDAAAMINGALAHAHAIDDTNESMRGHPSVPVLPALFAMAEELDASGRSVIAAYVVGVEIEAKLGRAVNDRHAQVGWHTTATLGPVGAAAGVAHLAGLTSTQTRNAIALAASLAGGLRANFGTMAKALMPGVAARNGILAARLAASGFTAGSTALEAPEGFLDMFCGKAYERPERALEALGRPFEILSPGVVYKLYPNCSLMHAAIDMVLEGVAEGLLHTSDVARVTCRVSSRLDKMRMHRPPVNGAEAKFSVEHCLAHAISKGSLGFEAFDESALVDPEIQRLLPCIQVEVDDISDAGNGDFASIEITHHRSPAFACSRGKPLGHPSNPLSERQMHEKFTACVEPKFGRDRTNVLWDMLGDLENQSMREVGRALAA